MRSYHSFQMTSYQLPGDISSHSSQVKCPPLSTTTSIPGLDPLTAILPSHTTDGINMMLQHYSYHDPATSQRDRIMDSEACFAARIHQSGSSWSALRKKQSLTEVKMMMREEAEPRLVKWRRYDEKLQRIVMIFNDYSTVTDYLRCISNLA